MRRQTSKGINKRFNKMLADAMAATRGAGPFVIEPDGTVTAAGGVLDGRGKPIDPSPPAAPPIEAVPAGKRPGRNQPCPCGSGRKYKKCCRYPTPSKRTPPQRR